ncbi:MAG TPA: helix-turn-helix transcriptional regulator [Vicinamibacterales bacterium]
MSDRDTFGPRLRSERERRGISLDTIAVVTNVSIELWQGLERNDFSRWPTGIFARAFVRDYAKALGLDADEVVDEFCRLFPIGDRRAERVIRAQAELIGHEPGYRDESQMIPGGVDRRSASRAASDDARARRMRFAPRTVAAVIDTIMVIAVASIVPLVSPAPFWPSLATIAFLYYGVATIVVGTSPGIRLTGLLQQRIPTLFAVQDRRAHA